MDLYGKLTSRIGDLVNRESRYIGKFKPNQGEAENPNHTADVAAGRVALGMVHLDPSLQGVPQLYYVEGGSSIPRVVVAGYVGWVNVWLGEKGEVHTFASKYFATMKMHDTTYDFGTYVGELVCLGLGLKEVITLADDIFRQETDMHRAAEGNWERVLKVSSRALTILKANM
jgi:hypothetical protein